MIEQSYCSPSPEVVHSEMRPISLDSRSMISNVARALLWYTPFRRFMYYRYAYNFTPEQLTFFVQCINETRDVRGDIFELGCATGHTTCFLNRHLQTAGIAKDYYCIDTFGGFTTADVAFEIEKRGKKRADFIGFRNNSLKRFEYTLKQNSCLRTFCVQSDVQQYEFQRPVSFCLLDVDLYQPTISALRKVWAMLSPGGMIVVDDCKPANQFDGALQAYTEFTKSERLPSRYTLDKLGILKKQ
jgi:O-methyltransferase